MTKDQVKAAEDREDAEEKIEEEEPTLEASLGEMAVGETIKVKAEDEEGGEEDEEDEEEAEGEKDEDEEDKDESEE